MKRSALLDVIAGAYAARILPQLLFSPLASELMKPQKPAALARRHRLSPQGLEGILEFLALTTDLLLRDAGTYRWSRPAELASMRFQIGKFEGAYGVAVSGWLQALRPANRGRPPVDDRALAAAFTSLGDSVNEQALEAIEGSGVRRLLDLGCGTGALLRALARRNADFTGIGVDANPGMCQEAREYLSRQGLNGRIKILRGRAPGILRRLPAGQRAKVEGLHGASFLNEFFAREESEAVSVLKALARLFPGRTAWFVDYHGWLGLRQRGAPPLVNVLQDIAQLASGQGIPPRNTAAWERVYAAAGCQLVSARTMRAPETEWCLHQVKLPCG